MPGAEGALSKDLAAALIEFAPDALLLVAADGRIAFANGRAADLFGYGPAELAGEPVERLVPAPLREAHVQHRREFAGASRVRAMGAGRLVKGLRRDGSELSVDVSLSPVCTQTQSYVAVSVRDAGPRLEAERALREAEERFRKAFDEASIGMALVGLDGRFLRVNRAFSGIVGYDAEELTSHTFQQLTHPADVDADVTLAGRLARGEIPYYRFAKRYLRKDGGTVPVELSASIVRDRDGAPLYFIAQVEDVSVRLKAEAALRKSEADFRMLIDQASDAIFIATLDGRYIDVNRAGCQLLDYRREELLSMRVADVCRPEDLPRLARHREALELVPGRVEVIEWQIKRRDGQFIPVEISAKILPDGRWVGFVRDIAERKRVEQALLQSEESLRRAQRVARLGSWDWDLRSDVVTRSPEFLAILGVGESYARAGALELMHLVAPEDRQRVLDEVYRAVRDVGSFTCEVRILRPDGCETFVLQQGEVITDENGAPARLVGTVLDITERKHIEQQREASYRWLRTVLDQAAVGLLLVQAPPDARIDANARALAMIGRPIERIDQYPGLLGTPDGKPVAGDQLPSARTLRGERLDSVEYVLHRADGTSIPVLASAAPIFGDDGRVLGGVVAFQDVSAAKELERLRAEWGSVVAHDLRQPINTIALTSALLSRTAHDPRLDRAFRQIDAAARRLDRMVGDLMDLSRLEARRLELQREPIDVAAAVRASVERMAPQAPEDRPIEIHVHDDPPRAYADPDRVAQVVENLLTNAVKYGSPGTPIALDVGRDDGAVAVEVTNDGRPLSREECDRLFQRFYRTQQGRVSGIAGTGLGLYIARELVEAHGGRIGVASSPAGKNTFRFTLPAAS